MELNNLSDFKDLVDEFIKDPIIWVGSRSSDVLGLTNLFKIKGIASVHSGEDMKCIKPPLPILSADELFGVRKKRANKLLAQVITSHAGRNFLKHFNNPIIFPYNYIAELEDLCKGESWRALSSNRSVREFFRSKTNLGEIHKGAGLEDIPKEKGYLKDFDFKQLVKKLGLPLFLQFSRGSAGSGNRIVWKKADFEKIKKEKGEELLNINKFIRGRTCSVNGCITKYGIVCGALRRVLVGISEITDNPTAYCGTDWGDDFSESVRLKARIVTEKLGQYMAGRGYLGYFNPDFILDEESQKLYITEINPRISASSNTYANLQIESGEVPLMGLHILEHLGISYELDVKETNGRLSRPRRVAHIYLKNKERTSVIVRGDAKPGIYKLEDEKSEFVRPGVSLDGLKNTDEFLVSHDFPYNGFDVESGAHLVKITARRSFGENTNELSGWGHEVVNKVYDMFDFRLVAKHDKKD